MRTFLLLQILGLQILGKSDTRAKLEYCAVTGRYDLGERASAGRLQRCIDKTERKPWCIDEDGSLS